MTNTTANASVRFDSIRADETGLAEMDTHKGHSRPLVVVPRASIRSVEVGFASGAERPLVIAILGVVVLLVAAFPLLFFAAVLIVGGQMRIEIFTMLAMAPFGIWLLWFALKKRMVLLVQTQQGRRKLVFSKSAEPAAAQAFVAQVAATFGYGMARFGVVAEPLQPGA
jgi:hypothetical protein